MHFATGAYSFQKMYVVHCADFLDSCLWAGNDSIEIRLIEELRGCYDVGALGAEDVRMAAPRGRPAERFYPMYVVTYYSITVWGCEGEKRNMIQRPAGEAASVYVSNAREFEQSPLHGYDVYM